MSSLSAEERAVVDTVAEFVDRDVRPVVRELEHANEYPELLGGEPGHGFAQMMKGLEIGRIQVASRAVGVAQAACDMEAGMAKLFASEAAMQIALDAVRTSTVPRTCALLGRV